ncbi:MAG TPA: CHASE domain-containing protein [Aquabacterium sp.]|uniref:CHASE domain-containing protein n=1 Tax=Aquabacterium sp. TaxID=1872578 RepID=UPI002E2FC200|nr:CHASE domain-containing protein [Aquabacterium sp.]HEX5358238.1 CHASE domain-containing protein [Aquabacterium sp.]
MSQRSPLSSLTIRGLITWLSYSVTGLLAVSLSAPHERVSPLYLPAGLALAFLMGWGPGMLLPIGLGAAAVILFSALPDLHTAPWQSILSMALIGGAGASMQAWVAWRLTQSPDRRPLTLERPFDIGRFLLLAGPVACLVNATISIGARTALGLMPTAVAPQAFLGWWTGDTLGVLVGAPMMLTLVGQPAALWRARRQPVGIPLLIATVLLALGVREVQVWAQERETAVFEQDVLATTNAVNLRLNGYRDALAALSGVFQASEQVTRDEFAKAARYWIGSLKGIQAAGWDERLYAPDLPLFEAQQQREGLTSYKVFDTHKRLPPTGNELAVVRYIEPRAGNEAALGYNALSTDATREAYEQARREDRVMATRGFRLMQERGQQTGIVIYQPVFKGSPFTPQTRVQANTGAVFLALRMDDAINAMLQGHPAYLEACMQDVSAPGHPLLGGTAACRDDKWRQLSAHRTQIPIEFAGRQWQLTMWSAGPVPVVGRGMTSWLLAIGGVSLAAALGALLLVMTGHTSRIEAAMEEARAQRSAAELANQAKSDFLSRMSHELRTPLNAVLGFAQVMSLDQREPLPPTQRQRVEQIQQAGWHLLDMIDDVLDISRIDMGTLKLQAQSLRIRDELSLALKLLQEDADKNGVTLSIQPDIPPEWGVMADAARLRQILAHLLSNGIKFNQRDGKVSITVAQGRAEDNSARLLITVHDTGMGMNEQQLSQLFQPFNRLGREQGPTSGTGIGLVISRHLALLMGGQLDVHSAEGQGSTFTLSLPAVTMQPKEVSATRVRAHKTTTGGTPEPRHVLYVEDNLANSEVIRSALAARPWITVTVAPTTEEGLAVLHNRLRGSKPDLILLDVHLPDASGQELLKLIKANPDTVDIPVIMISADAMPEQIDAALSAGAACYLTKPVQLSELLRQVDELMPD